MRSHSFRLILGAAALTVAGAARAEFTASYAVHHLNPADALLALHVRVPETGSACRILPTVANDPNTAGMRGVLEASCNSDALKAKIESTLAAIDVAPPTQRFHVAVLAASRDEGAVPELTASEAKALADFKKVMTYKSFRVEAEAVIESTNHAHARLTNYYEVEMMVDPPSGGNDTIEVRAFQLRAGQQVATPSGGWATPSYIETSFSIKRGETLVLGSSVSDKDARVVLVTALP